MKETEGVMGVERPGRWGEHMEERRGQGAGGGEREPEDGEEKKRWPAGLESTKACWQERQSKCKRQRARMCLG